jgi:hypothetical protein
MTILLVSGQVTDTQPTAGQVNYTQLTAGQLIYSRQRGKR